MGNANAPLELIGNERDTAKKLAVTMNAVAAILFLLAAINIAGGIATLLTSSPSGLLAVIEGAITGLLGLVMWSSATDVRYMVETNFTSIHLGHALQDLTVFYQGQFLLALLLMAVACVRLCVG